MPKYISLLRFTEKGAREIKNSTARAAAFDKAAEKAGVRIEAQYWLLGDYDGLLIISADKEQQALKCLAGLLASGNVRSTTMPAFDAKQFAVLTGK